jgi:hypothetical protein
MIRSNEDASYEDSSLPEADAYLRIFPVDQLANDITPMKIPDKVPIMNVTLKGTNFRNSFEGPFDNSTKSVIRVWLWFFAPPSSSS